MHMVLAKLLYMSKSPMINKRITRKCIDAGPPGNAILETRKRLGTKEMVFDKQRSRRVHGGGNELCMNKPVLVFLFPNFESFQHQCLVQILCKKGIRSAVIKTAEEQH